MPIHWYTCTFCTGRIFFFLGPNYLIFVFSIQYELNQSGHGLVQEVETRWNSTLDLLKSVKYAMHLLPSLLAEAKSKHRNDLLIIDVPLLDYIIEVLEVPALATKLFSQVNVPTLHLKSTTKIKILNDLQDLRLKFSSKLEESENEDDQEEQKYCSEIITVIKIDHFFMKIMSLIFFS